MLSFLIAFSAMQNSRSGERLLSETERSLSPLTSPLGPFRIKSYITQKKTAYPVYGFVSEKRSLTMAHSEKTLDSRMIFDGKVIRVTLDRVELENGETSMREVVHHHGGACIMPVTDNDEIYMVRQFRYALGEEMWELPAGKLEAGEDPFEAAKRELEEECGVTADEYTPLGCIYPTVGYDNEKIYIWMAKGLHKTHQHLDADEFLDVHKVPFDQALKLVLDNTIRDSKTVAGILRYALMRRGVQ